MTVIGLTGPTGAGKTTALEALEELGFQAVDCDRLYDELLRTSPALREAIAAAFGDVFLPDGGLDRPGLARRVFADQRELERLNAIVYPAVSAAVEEKIRRCTQRGLVIDAINLLESGMGRLCDLTVALTAPPQGPPSTIPSIRPSMSSRIWAAQVGLGRPERFPLGAATGTPAARRMASVTG